MHGSGSRNKVTKQGSPMAQRSDCQSQLCLLNRRQRQMSQWSSFRWYQVVRTMGHCHHQLYFHHLPKRRGLPKSPTIRPNPISHSYPFPFVYPFPLPLETQWNREGVKTFP
ncbi:hypothetical protein MATL_G00039550 [Megalops atlanticus]|uniref:Uncharacterized protein n=1 Tax=Megalops atlanticus TaxID=7932 RepID=A0A9D3QC17_MEGAT|nr:hypothetical protein MATL_G00039550 [Megalops atlanticus]